MIKRPMKAETAPKDLSKLRYPLIASPKLDGIRCVKIDGKILSNTLKPIPNNFTRERLEATALDGFDGELMVGETFQACTSGIMSFEGEPDVTFWVFDFFGKGLDVPYSERLRELLAIFKAHKFGNLIRLVPHVVIESPAELEALNERYLEQGFEGTMTRDPAGEYKQGRSTLRQQWLLKVKPFEDSEAEVIGFEEQMRNENEATINEIGLTKRSSSKDGKVPAGTLGKFIARDVHGLFPGVDLKIGSGRGLTKELRQAIWDDREAYVGKIVKYKYQAIGTKDAPRIPIFLGFRDPKDMG